MKFIVMVLAALAVAKVGMHEYFVRSATSEVIVLAYKDRAIAACQREASSGTPGTADVWSSPDKITLAIGKSSLPVYFWQVDHALWNARYKNPYLYLSAGGAPSSDTQCEFDVVAGRASITRL